MTKFLLRMAAILAVGIAASACSSVPGWVDPTTWMDDGPQQADSDDGQAPDLADIPAKPQASTPDDQKQVADSLASDRTQTTYSAQALRAGTETSAPPPPDPTPDDHASAQPASQDTAQVTAHETPSAPAAESDASASTSDSKPAPAQVATAEPPPALPQTARPASDAPPTPAQAVDASDAAMGFRPSAAPPLDTTVAQFVPSSVIDRYRQTGSAGSNASDAPQVADDTPTGSHRHHHHKSSDGVGGPESMSGDVVANMDAIDAPATTSLAAYADPSGNQPAAVVFFPGDGTALNAASRAKVDDVAKSFLAKGGQGFIKVVGHSSSRTANMPMEKHLELIFQRSQDRANAVAHEIMRQGVAADKVLVNAVGDSQPVYYESMPQGEEGNRRAEIYLQS